MTSTEGKTQAAISEEVDGKWRDYPFPVEYIVEPATLSIGGVPLIPAYAITARRQWLSKQLTNQFLVVERNGTLWIYGNDYTEDVPGSGRPPWSVLWAGSRFIPVAVMDQAGLWTAAGQEIDPGDPVLRSLEAVLRAAR